MSHALEILRRGQDRPVWSLVVTILGDRTLCTSRPISGSELTDLFERLSVKPQAVRTALHRLRSDGWIEAERVGRRSEYRLTEHAMSQTHGAIPLIYDLRASERPDRWSVIFGENGAISIGAGLSLRAGPLGGEPGIEGTRIRLSAQQMALLWPRGIRDLCAGLASRLSTVETIETPREEASALRVLVVHDWRRIALRLPPLPDDLGPPDWRGAELRRLVGNALRRWPEGAWLSAPDRS